MTEEEIRYDRLKESQYGPEELFILISSIEDEDIDIFLKALADLIQEGLLACGRWYSLEDLYPTWDDLPSNVQEIIAAGNDLGSGEIPKGHPIIYQFMTAKKGLEQLEDEDRPEDGYSRREIWRNKKTGETVGVHQKFPTGTTKKGKPKHPYPYPDEIQQMTRDSYSCNSR